MKLAFDGEGDSFGIQAFQEIAKVHVTENIFSQFMYKMLPTCNHLWTFKKSFCMQLALSGASILALFPRPSDYREQELLLQVRSAFTRLLSGRSRLVIERYLGETRIEIYFAKA